MKKILILSYYFPPVNLTPSERIFSFVNTFKENGFEPIVITRDWSVNVSKMQDAYISSGTEITKDDSKGYRVYYTPYRSSFSQKVFRKFTGTYFYPIYLIISFFSLLADNLTSKFTGLEQINKQAEHILSTENIDLIFVTASPFHLFKFGHNLSKKYNVPWVADYRDDWNTNELNNKSFIRNIVTKLSSYSEKKWLSNVSLFVSVSEHYVQKIQSLINRTGITIENGFLPENYQNLPSPSVQDKFIITYIGSLYNSQPIEIFIEGVIKFLRENSYNDFRVEFVGLSSQLEAMSRIKKLILGFESYFLFTDRISKDKAIAKQLNSTILLICAHNKLKGTPGSKLYEYLVFKKPVLVCPSDDDIIKNTLQEAGLGIVCENSHDAYLNLKELYHQWSQNHQLDNFITVNKDKIDQFSREKLSLKLINHLRNKKLL